jgi:hypothetical protein
VAGLGSILPPLPGARLGLARASTGVVLMRPCRPGAPSPRLRARGQPTLAPLHLNHRLDRVLRKLLMLYHRSLSPLASLARRNERAVLAASRQREQHSRSR